MGLGRLKATILGNRTAMYTASGMGGGAGDGTDLELPQLVGQ